MTAALVALALAALPVTPDALRARYANVRLLTADVTQVKEGRFWARPFTSTVRLRYTPERIVWETVAPIRSTAVIEGERLTVRGADGSTRDFSAMASDPKFAALLRFLRALIALDLDRMERDFVLRYGADELVARPRPGSQVALFTAMTVRFGPDLDVRSLDLETANERTHLVFTHLEREPPAPESKAR